MSTITLKTTSKKKLDLIEALAKELGITVQKDTDKMPNTTTMKAIKDALESKQYPIINL